MPTSKCPNCGSIKSFRIAGSGEKLIISALFAGQTILECNKCGEEFEEPLS